MMMSKCEGRLSGYDDELSKCCRRGGRMLRLQAVQLAA